MIRMLMLKSDVITYGVFFVKRPAVDGGTPTPTYELHIAIHNMHLLVVVGVSTGVVCVSMEYHATLCRYVFNFSMRGKLQSLQIQEATCLEC